MKISFRSLLSRRRVVQFVFVVASLVTLVAAAVAVENYRTRRAWVEYRAEAQKRGVKLDLEQLLPQPLADEENLALTPLFRELDAKGKEAWKNFLNLPVSAGQPDDASDGKATDLKPWRYVMLDQKIIDTATEDPAADVLRGLERTVGPDLDRLAETLATRPLHVPLRWIGGFQSAAVNSPYWKFQGAAAHLYNLRLTARIVRGEGALAMQDLLSILRLSRTLEDQPSLLCGMLRIAMNSIAVSGIKRGLAAEVWTEPELSELADAVSSLEVLGVFRQGLEGERTMFNDLAEQLLRDPLGYQQLLLGRRPASLQEKFEYYTYVILIPECWFRWNQLMQNQWFDVVDHRIDPVASRIYSDQGRAKALEQYARDSWGNRLRFLLFNAGVIKLGDSLDRVVADVHTSVCHARIAIALERFRLANGRYPEVLDQLIPSYLPKLPIDAYTGEPFYYRQTEEGRFVLADSKSAPQLQSTTDVARAVAALKKESASWYYNAGGVWHYVPTPPKH